MKLSGELCRWLVLAVGLIFCFGMKLAASPLLLPGYDDVWLLPLAALFCVVFLLWKPLVLCRTPFLALFSVVLFFRYGVLSWVMLFSGTYYGVSGVAPAASSLEAAQWYMVLELVIASAAIRRLYARGMKTAGREYDCGMGPVPVYTAFIVLTAALMLFTPAARSGIMMFSSALSENASLSFWALGVRECADNARFFLLFCLIFALRCRAVPRLPGVLLLGAAAALIVGVQIGTNRKIIIASALALACVLARIWPQRRGCLFTSLGGIAVLLVAATTLHRAAAEGIGGDILWRHFSSEYLQAYLLGQYNIAIGLEAASLWGGIGLEQAFLELLRPVFAIGSLFKEHCVMLSKQYFDIRMSMGLDAVRHDQIMPMVMQGKMLFGLPGILLFTLIPVYCGFLCDRLYRSSPCLEYSFLGAYLAFYFAQSMILNMTILINNVTFMTAIFLPVVLLGKLMKRSVRTRGQHGPRI